MHGSNSGIGIGDASDPNGNRVAVISDSRRRGGAALATARVFDSLDQKAEWEVRWFVSQDDGTQDERTVLFASGGVVRRAVQTLWGQDEPWRRRALRVWARFRNRRNLLRLVRDFQPEIISLHSINEWTDAALQRTVACDLCKIAPVVWTLHDMWPLTGYADYPDEYIDPLLDADRAFDLVFRKKADPNEVSALRACAKRLAFVAPSQWIGGLARAVFEDVFRVVHIPHGVDLEKFKPLPKQEARRWLDIPDDGRPVMAAAATSLGARRKGMGLLVEALARLEEPLVVTLFGAPSRSLEWPANVQVVSLGFLNDARLLRAAYSAADVFVMPSLAEMFGLVLIEAMACGTPCVGFAVGGVSEIIRPGETGFLARRGDGNELAEAIRKILECSPQKRSAMSAACRRTVEQEYDLQREVQSYADLFAELARNG